MSVAKDICFEINSSKKIGKDEERKIDKHLKKVYSNPESKKHIPKRPAGDYPYTLYFPGGGKRVCFAFKGAQVKANTTFKEISKKLDKNDLKVSSDIKLKGPIYPKEAEKITVDILKKEKGWTTLSHNGPDFVDPYKPHGKPVIYKGKKINLSTKPKYKGAITEEEAMTEFARVVMSDKSGTSTMKKSENPIFKKNFWNDFKSKVATDNKGVLMDLDKIDFSPIIKYLEKQKEDKKNISQKEKDKLEKQKRERKSLHETMMVDGHQELLGLTIEPPGIFRGRGTKPIDGIIKDRIQPDDVVINIGSESVVPRAPHGYKWNSVVHDQSAVWMYKHKSVTGKMKYGYPKASGVMKAQADYTKFEKARALNKVIDKVREIYGKDLIGKSREKQQLATIVYLIDWHALRIGGKHDEEKDADTMGASTLEVSNVIPVKEGGKYLLKFDFLGKDSIPFKQTLNVEPEIYQRVKDFMKGKKKDDLLFEMTNPGKVNDYLKDIAKKVGLNVLTAKIFRTRAASKLFSKKLNKIKKTDNSIEMKLKVNEVNEEVGKKLNHVKTETVKGKESFEKQKENVEKLEKEIKESKKKSKKGKLSKAEEAQLEKKKERLKKMQAQLQIKKTGRKTAKGTSKANYIDPRIYFAWAKENNVDLDKVKFYTKTEMDKFKWAIDTIESSKKWKY